MPYNRDSQELRDALETHSVAGYPVEVPTFGSARITRQGGTGPIAHRNVDTGETQRGAPQPFFVVKIDNPMPFARWAEQKRLSKEPLTPAQWEELLEKKRAGVVLGDEALKKLERGESVSLWEAEYEAMYDGGQLDGDGNIVYANFFPSQVRISPDKLRRDMLVDFAEQGQKVGVPGRFWGAVDVPPEGPGSSVQKAALLELFSPMPYMEAPNAIASPAIKKDFASKFTFALGYGTAQAWEIKNGDGSLPPGEYVGGEERVYYLKEAIQISKVEKLCKDARFKDFPHCIWQSLVLNILPVWLDKGDFRPLPENVIQADMVVSYGDE
jgi:hypothetical protein